MKSGRSKMYVSFKVRNPGPAVYDLIQEVVYTNIQGDQLYVPWPTNLAASVNVTYLNIALEGGPAGLGVVNEYVMEYVDGRSNSASTHGNTVLMLMMVLALFVAWGM